MSAKPRILVVEDEEAIRVGICDVLVFKGYEPIPVADGDEGLQAALAGGFELAMLDVMLPGTDGFSICRALRDAHPGTAILMLTAKGSEGDVLEGFQAGADDYVTKPFSVAQLMARVAALLRRVAAPESFDAGGIGIDPGRLRAGAEGVWVDLSSRDIDVLARLARQPGHVVSRVDLLRDVWGYQRAEGLETRCVDMHIAKLRRKLKPLQSGRGDGAIETVRGAGYRLRDA
jgi:DNA-binding response OmpR family regulator